MEGAHDVQVVASLLALSNTPHLADRVLVAGMVGVQNLATAADSLIVTEFTDLHVLAVSDNGRTERLRAVLDHARQEVSAGSSPQAAIKMCGLRDLRRRASYEERALLDLMSE